MYESAATATCPKAEMARLGKGLSVPRETVGGTEIANRVAVSPADPRIHFPFVPSTAVDPPASPSPISPVSPVSLVQKAGESVRGSAWDERLNLLLESTGEGISA